MHDESPEELRHELNNVEQEKRAVQHLLKRATNHIEELVESNCDPEVKAEAAEAAKRFRRATRL